MSKKNKDILKTKLDKLIENGRKEITSKEELEKFRIGSLISYMNINDNFKKGGFIIKFADEYFIYITPDFLTKYRVRYKNIKKMWVGDPFKVRNDVVSIVKTKQKKTNFPVQVGGITVYYAAKTFDKQRFMNTDKYNTMISWYNYFIGIDN